MDQNKNSISRSAKIRVYFTMALLCLVPIGIYLGDHVTAEPKIFTYGGYLCGILAVVLFAASNRKEKFMLAQVRHKLIDIRKSVKKTTRSVMIWTLISLLGGGLTSITLAFLLSFFKNISNSVLHGFYYTGAIMLVAGYFVLLYGKALLYSDNKDVNPMRRKLWWISGTLAILAAIAIVTGNNIEDAGNAGMKYTLPGIAYAITAFMFFTLNLVAFVKDDPKVLKATPGQVQEYEQRQAKGPVNSDQTIIYNRSIFRYLFFICGLMLFVMGVAFCASAGRYDAGDYWDAAEGKKLVTAKGHDMPAATKILNHLPFKMKKSTLSVLTGLGLLVFGIWCYFLYRNFRKKPMIILSADGLTCRGVYRSWGEVYHEKVELVNENKRKRFVFKFKYPGNGMDQISVVFLKVNPMHLCILLAVYRNRFIENAGKIKVVQ